MTNRQTRIRDALQAAFSPTMLEIIDDSARHAGHAGAGDAVETHFTLRIAAPELSELGRIGGHRAINDALKEEFDSGLHALTIRILPHELAADD